MIAGASTVNFSAAALRVLQMLKKALISVAVVALPGTASLAFAARSEVSLQAEPHFVKVPEITVPVIDGERIKGRLVFDIVVDAGDAAAASRLAVAMPRLRSVALVTGIEFSRLHVSGLTTVDAELLAHVMTLALRHEDPGIGRVLIVRVGAAAG